MMGQNFDCDAAIEAGVAGAVHLAHPARPERRHNLVWAKLRTCTQHDSMAP
jgi:hypothetical protein